MTALIYIDPQAIHPVIDGVWHRGRFTAIPKPGQGIRMLCGATGTAAFEPLERRRDHAPLTTCFDCEAEYMRENDIPVPANHASRHSQQSTHRTGRL